MPINVDDILSDAHEYFLLKQYDKALFLYSQVLSLEPNNIEYQLYCLFCDIASENAQKGENLYLYFIVNKELDLNQTVNYIKDAIGAYDGNINLMMKLFNDISKQSIESLDAIDYKDFLEFVKSRGSFKVAYEDIMFSTKVAIKSKEDLISFIEQLIENNFDSTAYEYLDNFNEIFVYDEEFKTLYKKLESKQNDYKHK